jgi:hypothetical protein
LQETTQGKQRLDNAPMATEFSPLQIRLKGKLLVRFQGRGQASSGQPTRSPAKNRQVIVYVVNLLHAFLQAISWMVLLYRKNDHEFCCQGRCENGSCPFFGEKVKC